MAIAALGDRDQPRAGRHQCHHIGADKAIVNDDIGNGQRADGAQGEQIGSAGASTDKQDPA
jgi:hypothetical protein